MTRDLAPPGSVYAIYAGLTALSAPLVHVFDASKMRKRGVPSHRIAERRGVATSDRPEGRLVWFHAVSVGETLSILDLIETLGDRLQTTHFLVTTVTTTAAEALEKRLPPRTRHQYAPLDTPKAARRFLDHWQPNLACFVESEIWPRLIIRAERLGTPMALVNARLSERSLKKWRALPGIAKSLFSRFSLILAQNQRVADGVVSLGANADAVHVSGDLKSAASRLPVDETALADIKADIGSRPLWVAASTHAGEEELVLEAHKEILSAVPEALLILAPRHPERGAEIAQTIEQMGLSVASRSLGETPKEGTQVWLVDTLGELGLWYSLSTVAFLGGSLQPIGGHNPYEPMAFGTFVLYGPGISNFVDAYDVLTEAGLSAPVSEPSDIAPVVLTRLAVGEDSREATASGLGAGIRTKVANHLIELLERSK